MNARTGRIRTLTFAALSFALAAPATADDFYVDPVFGDDAASGTSPPSAWRTLRFALQQTNGKDAHTLHLLPGVHADPSILTMTDSLTLIGDQGPDVTFVQPEQLRVIPSGGAVGHDTVAGLTIRNATRGLAASVPTQASTVTIRIADVRFEGCSVAIHADLAPGRRAVIEARRADIDFAAIGILVAGDVALRMEDCRVVNTIFRGIDGLRLLGTPIATAELVLRRSLVADTVATGVHVGGALVDVRIEDSLIVANADGMFVESLFGRLDVERSTIAGNSGFGLLVHTGAPMASASDSIFALNGLRDIGLTATTLDLRDSLVGDGSVTGPGVITGAPLFVDPSAQDYRLRPSSPAVDRLPATLDVDFEGLTRDVDGDLELVPARDLGAIELRPFRALGPAVAGLSLGLEVIGPVTGQATVAVAPVALVVPATSPYGQLALDPAVAWRALRVALPGGGGPVQVSLQLPLVSAGETWGLQTLIPSSSSTTGAAFSNAIEIVID